MIITTIAILFFATAFGYAVGTVWAINKKLDRLLEALKVGSPT